MNSLRIPRKTPKTSLYRSLSKAVTEARSLARPSRGLARRTCEPSGQPWPCGSVRRSRRRSAAVLYSSAASSPLGHSRWPSMLRPTTRSASQSAVTCVAAGIVGADSGGVVVEGFPEPGHILPQLAHHHVAAVETKIEEALRRACGDSSAARASQSSRHHRAGRLLVMGVGVAQQDLARAARHARIARCRLAVAEDDGVVRRAVRSYRRRELAATGRRRSRNARGRCRCRRAAGRARAGGRSSRRAARALPDLLAPRPERRPRPCRRAAAAHARSSASSPGARRLLGPASPDTVLVLRDGNVAAPARAPSMTGSCHLSFTLSPSRRSRSSWYMPSRNGAENVASASARKPDFCRPVQVKAMAAARVSSFPSLSVMGATFISVCSQRPSPVRHRLLRPVAVEEQRLGRRQPGEAADHDALRLLVVRRLQPPARAARVDRRSGHRSRAHAAASCGVSVALRSPSAMRALRSIWSTVRSR